MKRQRQSLLLSSVLLALGVITISPVSATPLWQKPLVAPAGHLEIGISPGANGTVWVENATGAGDITNIDSSGGSVSGSPVLTLSNCSGNASGLASAANGSLWATCFQPSGLLHLRSNGARVSTVSASPWGVAVDPQGSLWVSDLSGNVTQYSTDGRVTGIRITGLSATDHPVAIDGAGRIWVVEDGGVVQYSPAGLPTGVTVSATNDVGAIAVDRVGHLWAISTGGDVVRGFSVSGAPLGAPLINPDVSPNRVYFATFDSKGNFWFTTGGAIQEVAGVGSTSSHGPSGAFARPGRPGDVVVRQYANTATLRFTAGSDGNLPTHYLVTAFRNGHSAGVVCKLSTSRQCLVSSLAASTSYSFVVTAVNVLGRTSSVMSSPVRFVSPVGTGPTAPLNLRLVPGAASTVLRWTPAVRSTASPIIGYECNGGTARSLFVTSPSCVLPRRLLARHGGFVVLSVVAVDAAHHRGAPALLDIKLS